MLTDQAEARESAAKARIAESKKILGHHTSDETTQEVTSHTHIKTFEGSHHSLQSDMKADTDTQNRMNRFKERNLHGHSSDSQMKGILEGGSEAALVEVTEEREEEETELMDVVEANIEPIKDAESFEMMDVEEEAIGEKLADLEEEVVEVPSPDVEFKEERKATDETVERVYRPSIRLNPNSNASSVSPLNEAKLKKSIKFSEVLHHSKESSDSELDRVKQHRIDMFKQINLHGHASDSQMQNLLFNDSAFKLKPAQFEIDEDQRLKNYNKFTEKDTRIEHIEFTDVIVPYATEFGFSSGISRSLLTIDMSVSIKIKLSHMDNLPSGGWPDSVSCLVDYI